MRLRSEDDGGGCDEVADENDDAPDDATVGPTRSIAEDLSTVL